MDITIRPKYNPEYNPETKLYEDKCPIEDRIRIKIPYYCLCGGAEFSTKTEYKRHIDKIKHKKFLLNYIGYIKEVDDAVEHAKILQAKYELVFREKEELKYKYNQLYDESSRYLKKIV